MLWWMWLIAAVALLYAEIHSQAFFALFFAVGACAAAIVAVFGIDVWLQVLTFGVVSLAGVFGLRRVVKTMMDRRQKNAVITGMYGGMIGQEALTLDEVGDEHHPGHAQLARTRWLAINSGPAAIPANTPVVVTDVRGTTLIVKLAKKETGDADNG